MKNKKKIHTYTRARSKRHPERILQQEVTRLISQHIKGDVEWTHFPAGGGGLVRGAFLKSMGLKPGWPDLVFVQDGLFYGLELKVGAGVLSDNQRQRHKRLKICGATLGVARSVGESMDQLFDWGLIREKPPCQSYLS